MVTERERERERDVMSLVVMETEMLFPPFFILSECSMRLEANPKGSNYHISSNAALPNSSRSSNRHLIMLRLALIVAALEQ